MPTTAAIGGDEGGDERRDEEPIHDTLLNYSFNYGS